MKSIIAAALAVVSYVCIFVFFSGTAYSQVPEGLEESYYKFYYRGYEVDYTIYMDSTRYFVPLTKILTDMIIYYDYNSTDRVLSGYVTTPNNSFTVDLIRNKGEFRMQPIQIDDSQYFINNGTIFARLDLVYNAVGLNIVPNPTMLYMSINSDIDLPLVKLNKKYQLGRMDEYMLGDKFYRQQYKSSWSFFDGGMLDWELGMGSYNGVKNYAAGGNIGLRLLGGDLFARGVYRYNEHIKKNTNTYEWRWRTFFGRNPWITQATLGKLHSSSFRTMFNFNGYMLEGAQISNEEFQRYRLYDEYEVEDRIEPNWQVELYRNGELVGQMKSDSVSGKYWFKVPIYYGGNRFELRMYGTKGQYKTEEWNKDVTYELLRPGEVKYTFSYGNVLYQDYQAGEGRLSFGISSFMTNNTLVAKRFGVYSKPEIVNQMLITPFSSVIGKFEYFHEHFMISSLRYTSSNFVQTEVSHTIYDKKFQADLRYRTSLYASAPRIFGSSVGLNFRADRTATANSAASFVSMGYYWTRAPFAIIGNYYVTANETNNRLRINGHKVNVDVSHTYYGATGFGKYFNNLRTGLRAAWSSDINKITEINYYMSQPISNRSSYFAAVGYNTISKSISASLQLNINLSFVRMLSSGYYDQNSQSYNQSFGGSFGFDSENFAFINTARSGGTMAGNGAASVRFFLDRNDNEVFDSGDEPIENVSFYLSNEGGTRYQDGYTTRLVNMNPYVQCNFKVDKNSFPNPNWGPKYDEFSFVTDPNIFKVIDIPCYTGGVIEGVAVFQTKLGSEEGQAGLRLVIKNLKTEETEVIEVFGDGTFYKIGIAPGDYELSVDDTQLKILSAKAEPINFSVKNSIDGDYISGLKIVLIPSEQPVEKIGTPLENGGSK